MRARVNFLFLYFYLYSQMKSIIEKSYNAHEQHAVSQGVSAANSTGAARAGRWLSQGASAAKTTVKVKLDKGNIEENKKNLGPNLRPRAQRQGDRKAVLTEFICKNCNRPFDSQRGLSLHDTRHCKMKTDRSDSVLEGKRSIAVQDGLDSIQAQYHENIIWHQARTHTMSKHPPPIIADSKGKPRLKLPHVQDSKKWNKLDDAIFSAIVKAMPKLIGPVDSLFSTFIDTVYRTAARECGVLEKKEVKQQPTTNHRRRESKALHIQRLAKQEARRNWRKAKREGKEEALVSAHKALMRAIRLHHDLVRVVRKNREDVKRAKAKQRFLQDPHRFAKDLLTPPNQGKPTFGQDVADDYFPKTYMDQNRSFKYGPPPGLPQPPLPEHAFNARFPSFEEFSEICWKKSNGSAPGLNGIPYLLYKRCPQTRRKLFDLERRAWQERQIPAQMQVGRIRLIPKSEDTTHPSKMRPISVLNAEGRIFWTIFQQRLSKYMLDNQYIKLKVQKAFLHGVAGCVEHTTTHWEMLQNAKKAERQIVIAWLDLENAYGSVRHMLTQFALRWYHVPDEMIELLFRYYETIFLRVVTDQWSSKWFPLLIGAPQGCTASTIVFDVDFQIILDFHAFLTRKVHPGYTLSKTDIRICSPTYADDVELVADSPQVCQKSIDAFQCIGVDSNHEG